MRRLDLPAQVSRLADIHPAEWAAARTAFEACRGTMGGPAHVDLLYHIVRETRARRVVETGVAAGWSSMAILIAMEDTGTDGRLISVDMPYPRRANEHMIGCVVPEAVRHDWTLVRLPDRDALPAIVGQGPIGLAHYDSDKSYAGRMFGYSRLWDALEPGGLLISDDVEDNFGFRDFTSRVGRKPVVVAKGDGGYAGVLRK